MPRSDVLAAMLLGVVFAGGCGDAGRDRKPEARAEPAAASAVPASKKRPALPPDAAPPAAALAGEAEAIEVQLRRTDAYDALWIAPRAELNAFLTALSQMVSWNLFHKEETQIAPDRLQLAVSVTKYVLRAGRLPDSFAAKLDEHLAAIAKEPQLGVWGSKHDYAALAAWRKREDPAYQRELLRARRSGWLGWREPAGKPWLPYIALEVEALERLAMLDELSGGELEQLDRARADAKKRAPGVTRANYERLATGMTYEQAVALLGGAGQEMSSNEIAGLRTVMYEWRGDGVANMNATFQNGKLVGKAQMGLE